MEPIYNGQIGVSAFCPLWRCLLDEGLICIITLVHIRASVTCPLHGGDGVSIPMYIKVASKFAV